MRPPSRHSSLLNGGSQNPPSSRDGRYDVESRGAKPHLKSRFRDAVTSIIEDGRRIKMKKQLLEGMDRYNFEHYRKTPEQLEQIKDKKIRQFYENQNQRLDDWLEVDTVVRFVSDDVLESFDPTDEDGDGVPENRGGLVDAQEAIEPLLPLEEQRKRQKARRNVIWAININVVANVLLLAAKVFAAFFSSSLSLIASLVDSALDLLCTVIIWTTSKLVQWKIGPLRKRFPIGRRRLEPLGILVFSVIMIVSFLQILQESVTKLLPGKPREAATLPLTAVFAMLATIIVKGIIWIGCTRIKTTQVQALAQDCKTDVFFNSLSLAFPFIGHQFDIWWLDPVGAGILSLYILFDWSHTALQNVSRLTGIGVDDNILKKLLYLSWRFSPVVDSYKSITAYHAGDGVWCEVDLLLDEKTTLEHSHDLSETLQYCLEALPEVDRAFVTCDYTCHGPTGHTAEDG